MSLKIPVECYSRISGYFRPVNQWNPGKRDEFNNRAMATIKTLEDIKDENIS